MAEGRKATFSVQARILAALLAGWMAVVALTAGIPHAPSVGGAGTSPTGRNCAMTAPDLRDAPWHARRAPAEWSTPATTPTLSALAPAFASDAPCPRHDAPAGRTLLSLACLLTV
ncbi:MAG TPA: hypothetical protein DCX07_05990 [Phycisphaerales bacterium]|nr:hypothetical protein [Phycisphaerales bacterium]